MSSSCRGHSKAQTCFFKILHIISSTPPTKQQPSLCNNTTKGIAIDLNLRFSESESSKSENNDNNNNEGSQEQDDEEEEGEDFADKSILEVSEKFDNNDEEGNENENAETASFGGGDNSNNNNNNCLDLLIEAARVLSEKDEESDSEGGGESMTRREKRKERWVVVDLYGGVVAERETEPVVRSKRGRNQVLPYRFRDSVVEPLKRATRSQRTSSTTQLSKRLLRSSSTT